MPTQSASPPYCSSRLGLARLLLVLCLAVLAGRAAAQLSDYLLGPGDKVQVTVFGHPDLSTQPTVNANGNIAVPLLGQVKATGLTVSDLQLALEKALDKDYVANPRVSIEVITYRPFFILGEVQKPGKYDYIAGINVRMAVAIGGGYTRRALEEPVSILRADREGKQQRLSVTQDSLVLPGDTLEVDRRLF